uniref:hypothetical protein n=1 Tax=Nonomuraea sp. CA-251285 TaxID=3240002 RepID=UPI003F499907
MAPRTTKTGKAPKTYTMNARPLIWPIRSQSDPAVRFNVRLAECGFDGNPCKDFLYRHELGQNPMCKHIVAAFLQYMGMDAQTATELAPMFKALFDAIADATKADTQAAAQQTLTIALTTVFSHKG